jgi:hypothetical protein
MIFTEISMKMVLTIIYPITTNGDFIHINMYNEGLISCHFIHINMYNEGLVPLYNLIRSSYRATL